MLVRIGLLFSLSVVALFRSVACGVERCHFHLGLRETCCFYSGGPRGGRGGGGGDRRGGRDDRGGGGGGGPGAQGKMEARAGDWDCPS